MTRSFEEYQEILELWELGYNKKAIARATGIPRATVCDCITRFRSVEQLKEHFSTLAPPLIPREWQPEYRRAYAYVLAIYLGDGHISPLRSTYRLRIFMDSRYPNIIQSVVSALETLHPQNKHTVIKQPHANCVEVTSYSNTWVQLLPQHGEGVKHLRKLEFQSWQQEIIHEYPIEILRGLIHSDGCRIEPVINGKVYPRYQFSNLSEDIRDLFRSVCCQIGIEPTFYGRNFTIARRPHVELLDREIGRKC